MQIRPVLWLGKDLLWVRKREGHQHFAVKFVEALPDYRIEMRYDVVVKPLGTCSPAEAEKHVEWLLRKFTSYGWRQRVEEYLRIRLVGWDEGNTDDIAEMARVICRPEGHVQEPITQISYVPEREVPQYRVTDAPLAQLDSSDAIPKPRRSRYLENLLKGK